MLLNERSKNIKLSGKQNRNFHELKIYLHVASFGEMNVASLVLQNKPPKLVDAIIAVI